MLALSKETVETVARGLAVSPDASDHRPSIRVFAPRPEVGPTWMDRPTPEVILVGHDLDAMLNQAVEVLESTIDNENAWAFLFNVGLPVLPEAVAGRLRSVFDHVDPAALVAGDTPVETLRYAAEAAGRFASEEVGQAFLGRLSAFAPAWLKTASASEIPARLECLVEALAAAARSYEGTGPQRFSDAVARLVGACPDTAPAIRDILDSLIDRTPVRLAEPFWKALRAARAV